MFSRAIKQSSGAKCYHFNHSYYFIHVVAECEDFIAVDKPYGMFSQGGKNVTSNNNIIDAVAKLCPGHQTFSVHRLDRDTSGVMIFAKTKAMAQHLSRQFASGQVKKVYHAITLGNPSNKEGIIDEPIAEVLHGSLMRVCVDRVNGKPAKTHFQVKHSNSETNLAMVEFRPSTGRKHQLRVHCAFMNCPILGDVKYGGLVLSNKTQRKYLQDIRLSSNSKLCRLMLHASELGFVDMKGEEHLIRADLPREFRLLTWS